MLFMLSRWWRTVKGEHKNYDGKYLRDCIVDFKNMDHTDFVDLDRRRFADTGIVFPEGYNYDRDKAKLGYAASSKLVLDFLNYAFDSAPRPDACKSKRD